MTTGPNATPCMQVPPVYPLSVSPRLHRIICAWPSHPREEGFAGFLHCIHCSRTIARIRGAALVSQACRLAQGNDYRPDSGCTGRVYRPCYCTQSLILLQTLSNLLPTTTFVHQRPLTGSSFRSHNHQNLKTHYTPLPPPTINMSIKMNAASAAAILAALAVIPAVSAHGHVKEIVANGETVAGTTPNWVYQETNTPGCMYNQT